MTNRIPNNLSALHELFKSGGNLCFVVPKRRLKSLKLQFERIYKSDRLFSKNKGLWGKLEANIYAAYVALNGIYISWGSNEAGKALLVFQTCWRFLAPLEVEHLEEGMAKIIFRGKVDSFIEV